MELMSILRSFGAMLVVIAAAMAPPMFVALSQNNPAAGAYMFAMLITAVTGAGALAASQGRHKPSDFRGALIVILIWWCIIPVFSALPFAMSGMTYADAYFETVSAITTTGGWLSAAASYSDDAGALWRAELQWLGGLASLAIAAAIFIRPMFVGIDTILPPFSRGDRDSYLRALRNAISSFAIIYAAITAFSFVMIALAGAPGFEALIISMSAVSTGGFIPREGGVAAYDDYFAATLFPMLILGGANFILFARLVRGARERVRDIETRTYFAMIFIVGFAYWVLSGAGDVDLILAQFFNAASLLSTNGYLIGEHPPLTISLVTAMIGGAAVSTAGGFKILRWMVITRRAREELRRLVLPNAVQRTGGVANELGVWIHFMVFTMTLAVLVIVLSVGGHPFDVVVAASTAALSNTGPLLSLANPDLTGYEYFDPAIRWLLLVAMIIGRLEAAAALALFNIAFWRS